MYMSEQESYSTNDLMKKITIVSKNIKSLTGLVKTIDEKLNIKPNENRHG